MGKTGQRKMLRLLLVDDEELVLAAFSLLAQQLEGVEVVGTARSGAEAVAQVRKLNPDLVIMDLKMPGMDGIEATKLVRQTVAGTKVVALTALEDPGYITRALEAGVDGFILKKASPQELHVALERVSSGERYLSPPVAAIVAQAYLDERNRKANPPPGLTEREQQVVKRLSEGMRIKEIAAELGISERTAEKHSEHARRKLGAATTAAMTAMWLKLHSRD